MNKKHRPMFTKAMINKASPKRAIGKLGQDFANSFRTAVENTLLGNPTEVEVSLICTAINFFVALETRNIIVFSHELNEVTIGITKAVRRWEETKVFRFDGKDVELIRAFVDFFGQIVPTISERDYFKNCNLIESTLNGK